MSRFAISDIHGCAHTFKALLDKINFSKKDELFLLGDYIDRGPDSKGVIDHIWFLQKEGYQVRCLRGNHEQMLLDEITNPNIWFSGDTTLLQSFGIKHNKYIPDEYINWMEKLDYFFQIDKYILVHAGLNFTIKNPLDDLEEMMWIRDWYDKINKNWLGDRIIVHGHTPIIKSSITSSLQMLETIPVINIDAGCVFEKEGMGNLCALNLTTHQLTFHKNID